MSAFIFIRKCTKYQKYYDKVWTAWHKNSKESEKNMGLVNERLLAVKDHLEDEIIQLSDITICLQIIEGSFVCESGDEVIQEAAFIRVLCRLLQMLLENLKGNYVKISEVVSELNKN